MTPVIWGIVAVLYFLAGLGVAGWTFGRMSPEEQKSIDNADCFIIPWTIIVALCWIPVGIFNFFAEKGEAKRDKLDAQKAHEDEIQRIIDEDDWPKHLTGPVEENNHVSA